MSSPLSLSPFLAPLLRLPVRDYCLSSLALRPLLPKASAGRAEGHARPLTGAAPGSQRGGGRARARRKAAFSAAQQLLAWVQRAAEGAGEGERKRVCVETGADEREGIQNDLLGLLSAPRIPACPGLIASSSSRGPLPPSRAHGL